MPNFGTELSASQKDTFLSVLDDFLSEYREIYAAVATMLQEARMIGEIVVLAVLEYEDAFLVQQVAIKNEVWNLWQFLQCVWWVGEDEIKLLLARLQKAKDIATYQDVSFFI